MSLGTLEKVDLRGVWESESGHFTPWLAGEANLRLLGDAIGIELELEAQEKDVGPFRADILCKDTATGAWVLIENQLDRTDHGHLGQLLTYAAGLDAVTVVWVARQFTDEHRAALDWLNRITEERFNFFGLEIELWRIGDSAVAPKFNVVAQPNNWGKLVTDGASRVSGKLSDRRQLQVAFWTDFRQHMLEHSTAIRPRQPLPQNWMNLSLGRTGVYLAAIASFWDSERESYGSHELRAEVVTDGTNSKAFFATLHAEKDAIEAELGEPLTWYDPEAKRVCRIYLRKPTNLEDRAGWPDAHRWLRTKLEALHRVFGPRIKRLSAASAAEAE